MCFSWAGFGLSKEQISPLIMPPKSSFRKLMEHSKQSIRPKKKNGFAKPIPEGLKKAPPPYKNTLRSVTYDYYGRDASQRMMSTRQLYQEFDDWGGRGVSKEFLSKDKPYFEHSRERREQNELLRNLARKHGASSDVYRETLKRVEDDNHGIKVKPEKPRLGDKGPGGDVPHVDTVLRFGERVREKNIPSIMHHLRKHPKLILFPVVTLPATKYAPDVKVTVFEYAVRQRNLQLAKKLQQFHPPVDDPDAAGFQPMHYACYNSDFEMVKLLQSLGAKLEAEDSKGNPHLVIAAREGKGRDKLRILDFMLRLNIDINAVDSESGSSALMHSVRRLDLHTTRLLLEYGARQLPDKNGIAPIELALLCGNLELLLMLIEFQPDILSNSYAFGQSALHLAAGRQDDLLDEKATTSGDLTQVILAKKPALLNTRDRKGNTPLLCAVRQGNLAAVKWLVRSSADVDLENDECMTAVQLAGVSESSVHKEILFFLRREHGADMKFFEVNPEVLEKMEVLDPTGIMFREKLGKMTDMITKPAQNGCLNVLVRHGAYGRALTARRRALEDMTKEVEEEFQSRGRYNDLALNAHKSISLSVPIITTSPMNPNRSDSSIKIARGRKRNPLGMAIDCNVMPLPLSKSSVQIIGDCQTRQECEDVDTSDYGNIHIGNRQSANGITEEEMCLISSGSKEKKGKPDLPETTFATRSAASETNIVGSTILRKNATSEANHRRCEATSIKTNTAGVWIPAGDRPLSPAPGKPMTLARILSPSTSTPKPMRPTIEEYKNNVDLRCSSPDFGRQLREAETIELPTPSQYFGSYKESRKTWCTRLQISEKRVLRSTTGDYTSSSSLPSKKAPSSIEPKHGDWGNSPLPPSPCRFPDFRSKAEFKRASGVRTDEIEAHQQRRFDRNYGARPESRAMTSSA